MLFLLGSIVFTAYLTIAFKLCDKFGIDKFQAIVFNYFACTVTGCVLTASLPAYTSNMREPWFGWAVLMGLAFLIIFDLIARTVQKSGLAVASVASKLSLIIPFLFSVWLYGEPAGFIKSCGIVLALLAVVLTLYPSAQGPVTVSGRSRLQRVALPVAVFILTGLLDTLIKYVEARFITPANHDQYLIAAFSVAFVSGFSALIFKLISKATVPEPKAILAGIAIGIPNYFSIWFLVRVLKRFTEISTVIIPVNNLGIVLVSAIVAWLFFKEKLSAVNWAGIIMSIIAISLIAFGAN